MLQLSNQEFKTAMINMEQSRQHERADNINRETENLRKNQKEMTEIKDSSTINKRQLVD